MPSEGPFVIALTYENGHKRYVHEVDGTPTHFSSRGAAQMYARDLATRLSPLDGCSTIVVEELTRPGHAKK